MPLGTATSATSGSGLARDHAGDDIRRNAIVGHRLPGGWMTVHAPGAPCALCEGAPVFVPAKES